MLLFHKIIFLLQIKLFLISVDCLKKPESNSVVDDESENNKKELIEKLLSSNFKSAIQYDIKNDSPQVQVFTDENASNNNNQYNSNKQADLIKYQNFLKQLNYGQHNYVPQHYHHQHQHDINNYSNKMSQGIAEQKEIVDILNMRNNQKRDNHNQIKKQCSGKKHKNDDKPTPTYFYPKHINGELVVHNPAPIIVKRPPTKVVVNHPAIIVRPQPVLINRTPQAINPVMVYKPPPAPPAEPLNIRPVFVKFESDATSQNNGGNHPYSSRNSERNTYLHPHRSSDHYDGDGKGDIFGDGTNVNFKVSSY